GLVDTVVQPLVPDLDTFVALTAVVPVVAVVDGPRRVQRPEPSAIVQADVEMAAGAGDDAPGDRMLHAAVDDLRATVSRDAIVAPDGGHLTAHAASLAFASACSARPICARSHSTYFSG